VLMLHVATFGCRDVAFETIQLLAALSQHRESKIKTTSERHRRALSLWNRDGLHKGEC